MTVTLERATTRPPAKETPAPCLPEGFNSDVLFELEEQTGDCQTPRDHVEQLLVTLAAWRAGLIDGTVPAEQATAYEQALNSVREAWLQYSFRWVGGPELPYPFDLATPELPSIHPSCLIPGCNGYGHEDGLCETALDSLNLVAGGANALNVTVNADGARPVELAVWQDWNGDLIRTRNKTEARAFADRLRAFAAAVEQGAALLD